VRPPEWCPDCQHWSRGCRLSEAGTLRRSPGGRVGDEQTVQDWRANHGLQTGPDGLPVVEDQPIESCPGVAPIRRRR
jgi:hypothetical protein